jgi:polysaccharide export outer membrane protein
MTVGVAFGDKRLIRHTLKSVVLASALSLVLAGCQGIPRSGPAEELLNEEKADLAGFTLIEMSAANVKDYAVVPRDDRAGTAGLPEAPQVRLASGDMLKIRVAESKEGGLFAPLAVGGTSFDNVRVDHKGTISIPYAGRVPVAGLDPQKVEDRIRSRLAGVTFEPQVYVELVANRGSSVLVSGDVKAPGRFSLLEGPMTLVDAISKAGGATREPHQVDVVVRRGSKVARMPLSLVQGGRNTVLSPGDEVTLEANLKVFNALGSVTKTGQVPFSKLDPTLLDALSQVGGLANNTASNTGVFVFRLKEPHAKRDAQGNWHPDSVIFKFDMSKPETMFIAQAFAIKPDDTIYVTNAPTVEWLRALAPIAQTMATIRGTAAIPSTIDNLGN